MTASTNRVRTVTGLKLDGSADPKPATRSPPAQPAMRPATAKAVSFARVTLTPMAAAARSLRAIASQDSPHRDRRSRIVSPASTVKLSQQSRYRPM